jgi:hypothetical protein
MWVQTTEERSAGGDIRKKGRKGWIDVDDWSYTSIYLPRIKSTECQGCIRTRWRTEDSHCFWWLNV